MKVKFSHPTAESVEVVVGSQERFVGRVGESTDVVLPHDGRISRRHGRLWIEQEEVWYEDLGSSNGSWVDGVRLEAPVRLEPGTSVTLGETTLTLVAAPEGEGRVRDLPPGMTVQMQVRADGEGGAEALAGGGYAARYMSALYDFVQALLGSTGRELIPHAFRVIKDHVPAAQRISLVAWPPEPDGTIRDLVPPTAVEPGGTPISTSLARYAVDSGQALLLADAKELGSSAPEVGASVVRHGIRSAVYVPVVADGGQCIGVLCVDTPRPGLPFRADDFQFIRAVGGLLATALAADGLRENARRRELEAREEEARRQAMRAFLQIASHDLRSPLTVVMLSAHALRTLRDPKEIEALSSTLVDAGRRAQRLIASYLEASAFEAGEALAVAPEEVDLARLVDEEIDFARRAAGQSAAPAFQFSNRAGDLRAWADPQKLRQILANLLTNAIKYSPQGGEIAVEAEDGDGGVTIRVRDHGVGISAADQARLFQQFQRVGDVRAVGGVGLGLWLSAALVKAHGGGLRVDSAPDEGAVFSFTLPRRSDPRSGDHPVATLDQGNAIPASAAAAPGGSE